MNVKCPVCQTEYDLEPGKYKCECGATFLVEDPNAATETFAPPDDDPNKTIAPRHHADFDPAGDQTMPGKRDRKPDGYFEPGEMILNRYKVLGSLGRGGMGVVYKCFDEVGGIEIALKALPPELSHDEEEMEDIKANFQIVSKLVHQNICISKNLEKDNANGNYYLIMECVEGEDLRRWIRREKKDGKLTLEKILPLIRQVADALDYAHEQKIIHRDIKPGNIMVDSAGHVKVLDFGLAAQIHTSMTRVSMAYHGTSGTATYMAPEQWRGQAQGAAADQYALAAMTYEMLAGHLPFEGSDPTILREAVLNDNPAPIAGIPAPVQNALDKGLSKKPEDRFASCADFVSGLTSKKKSKKISKKFLLKILMSLMIAVSLGGVSYLGYWGYGKIQSTREKIRIEKEEKARQKREQEAARIAEEKRKEAARLEAEKQERLRAELAAKRERERIEAQARLEKYNRELAQKRKEAELAEKDRINKINAIYEKMFREITVAFEKAKKLAQDNYQKLSEEKQSRIEAVEKKQNDEIADFRKKISAWEQQKIIPAEELDRMFPLYKEGDKVVIPTKRIGTVKGTLYAIKGNTITVNSTVIARMDIPAEFIEPTINAQKRNLERNKRQAKFNYLIRLAENKIQDIEKSSQREKDKIESEISKAEKNISKLEDAKNRAYEILQNHRDEANRDKSLTIKPVDYNQIIRSILANGGIQWAENTESSQDADHQREIKDNNSRSVDQTKPEPVLLKTPHDLTANSSNPNFRVWSSSESTDQSAYGAMNGNIQEGCVYHSRKEMRPWWAIKFNTPVCVKSFWIQNRSMNTSGPAVFITKLLIQGSDDGTNWKTIKHFQLSNEPTVKSTVELPPNTFFSFYRIIAAARNYNIRNNYLIFGELEFQYYEMDSSVNSDEKNKSDTYQETESTLGRKNNITSQGNSKDFPEIITLPNGTKIEMVKIKAGSFMMGSPVTEHGRSVNETQHRVRLTKDYWIGKYPVTQQQYSAVMGNHRSETYGTRHPVELVGWTAAMNFCNRLNKITEGMRPPNYIFSLPSEAQWEYACRAGSTTAFPWGDDINIFYKYGNYCDRSCYKSWKDHSHNDGYRKTSPVGIYLPNRWGLYDMLGNVFEHCSDWSGPYPSHEVTDPVGPPFGKRKIRRGGSWLSRQDACRSAARSETVNLGVSSAGGDEGFRVALIYKPKGTTAR